MLLRLWGGTLVTNLIGGWGFTWLILTGYPEMEKTAVESGYYYVQLGFGLKAFSLAVLGGTVITLMTWMERGADGEIGRIVAAILAGFLLAMGSLNHAIVVSLEMFAALQGGAPFGYLDWLGAVGWATLGNIVGGLVLVTGLRLIQIGPEKIESERQRTEKEGSHR